MPQLRRWAEQHPHKPAALLAGSDNVLTYQELDRRANAVTQLLMWMGLTAGDSIAIMLDNDLTYFELLWGARRHGIYYTPISAHLTPAEAAYIVRDSGAKAFFAASRFGDTVKELQTDPSIRMTIFAVGGSLAGCLDYGAAVARFDRPIEIPEGLLGRDFCYSSGTTGKPKGIKQPLLTSAAQAVIHGDWVQRYLGFDQESVYLSPAPLYHAAPLRFTMRTVETGGTAVIMKKFDAEAALAFVEQYRITHSQWVPTMFFRLLALSPDVRLRYDLSSHRCAVHAAAPCPPEIKEQMIAWWGPIIWEYYAGSERNGATCISTPEWQSHRGSVGRACVGTIHILDDHQEEVAPGEIGDIYFDGPRFEYHNDAEKTTRSRNDKGWSTIGDVGYVDEDGYLYLTDRRSHMIISGGVNIYPAEIENCLALHPLVADVAVFGVPNREFGEEVKAVVQLKDINAASPGLEDDLMEFCRKHLSHVKCPRSIDFEAELPRQENGKLFKHILKKRYQAAN